MTINLLFFIITIKKVPKSHKTALHEDQQRKIQENHKAKMLEYRNRHFM